MPHRVALLVFPDFQLLDVAGPTAAFELAGRGGRLYGVRVCAAKAGLVRSSSGVEWQCRPLPRLPEFDTLMVVMRLLGVAPSTLRRRPESTAPGTLTGTMIAPRS